MQDVNLCSTSSKAVPKVELERALCLLESFVQKCLGERHCCHLASARMCRVFYNYFRHRSC